MFRKILVLAIASVALIVARSTAQVHTTTEEAAYCKTCVSTVDPLGNQGHAYGSSCNGLEAACVDCGILFSCWTGGNGTTCPEPHCGSLAAVDRVKRALRSLDGVEVLRVAAQMPKSVRVLKNGYVVVLGCEGAVVSATKFNGPDAHHAAARAS